MEDIFRKIYIYNNNNNKEKCFEWKLDIARYYFQIVDASAFASVYFLNQNSKWLAESEMFQSKSLMKIRIKMFKLFVD